MSKVVTSRVPDRVAAIVHVYSDEYGVSVSQAAAQLMERGAADWQARMAWQHGHLPERPWCETPRHAGLNIPAQWSMALVGMPDSEDITQSCCHQCMTRLARDLGTTPEAGAHSPGR